MTAFDIGIILDTAQRAFLLEETIRFSHRFRITEKIRKNHQEFEDAIKLYEPDGLMITAWAERKVSGVKIAIPAEISFDQEFLLKKRPHLRKIKNAFAISIEMKSLDINKYIKENYALCVAHHETFADAAKIADYILSNKESIQGLYLRQIPHGKSTKLLADHPIVKGLLKAQVDVTSLDPHEDIFEKLGLRSKPSVFQFFATKVKIQNAEHENFYGIINDHNFRSFSFPVKEMIIVENEEAYYPLCDSIKDGVVILGSGKMVNGLKYFAEVLKEKTLYWGDIDKEGYEILHLVRKFFPTIHPICMDFTTINEFSFLLQDNPTKGYRQNLDLLKEEYEFVCSNSKRLEQEQLPIEIVLKLVNKNTIDSNKN